MIDYGFNIFGISLLQPIDYGTIFGEWEGGPIAFANTLESELLLYRAFGYCGNSSPVNFSSEFALLFRKCEPFDAKCEFLLIVDFISAVS